MQSKLLGIKDESEGGKGLGLCVGGFGMENSNFGLQRTNPFAPFDDYPGLQQKSQCS